MAKKTSKKTKEPSWEQIGNLIGKKFAQHEKDFSKCGKFWEFHTMHRHKGHFFGALLFGIVLSVILNQKGILTSYIQRFFRLNKEMGFE